MLCAIAGYPAGYSAKRNVPGPTVPNSNDKPGVSTADAVGGSDSDSDDGDGDGDGDGDPAAKGSGAKTSTKSPEDKLVKVSQLFPGRLSSTTGSFLAQSSPVAWWFTAVIGDSALLHTCTGRILIACVLHV